MEMKEGAKDVFLSIENVQEYLKLLGFVAAVQGS